MHGSCHGCSRTMDEYPLTPDEVFLASNFDSFIPHDLLLRARKAASKASGPLIVGVDPARFGADSDHCLAPRQPH